jgi:predicted nucleic acid-binding protein
MPGGRSGASVPPAGKVLVDTSAWIDFFSGDAAAIQTLEELMNDDRIVTCGQVTLELLQGTRDEKALSKVEQRLSLWAYEAERPEDFREAARIYARLRWKGITIPSSDCLIAALAMRHGAAVYATDPHFGNIRGLELFVAR